MASTSTSASSSSTSLRRRVSSAAASRQPKFLAEIKPLLDSLDFSISNPDILERLQWLSLLKRVLIDAPEAKDTFRALRGFTTLLSTLHSFSGFYNSARSEDEKFHFIELIKCLFAVISEALQNHTGNRRFFSRKIGWNTLQTGLAATGLPTEAPDYLFGILLAFAMDDATLPGLVVSVKRTLEVTAKKEDWSMEAREERTIKLLKERLRSQFTSKDTLANPEVMPLLVGFQVAMPPTEGSEISSIIVLMTLHIIAQASKYNLAALHSTGILSTVLPRIWDKELSQSERAVLKDLAQLLIQFGINHLDDGRLLYKKALTNDDVAEFVLESLKTSRQPPHIQFDLSLHGYVAMELPTLGHPFPPTNSAGYTFSAWINIENFDPNTHTTIFGACDVAQRCFVLAYIERDTRKFILQTSMSAPKASVRFKSTVFEANRWYHISIVHRRSRATFSSKAALYIDGEFVEQVKSTYPQSPPSSNPTVQVWLGTPSNLAARVGKGIASSRWSLGTAHLFEEALSDDLIAVHYRLGPRYHGNFQDCLGSYQTYEASAALNMRNELMHPGREEKSDIVAAIRHKASNILPESKILFSFSATQVFDDRDDNNIDESMLVQNLSKQSTANLKHFIKNNAIAINAAVPSINEALIQPHGVAFLSGEPIVVVPQAMDDAAWRIGGAAAIGLKLVEAAKTPAQVCRAVSILFGMIKDSWRNSEAMEKENGFAVLGHLIRQKDALGVICKELLDIVLEFVGYNLDKPEESFIINPLAYRILLVDFDVWRRADHACQARYFDQFKTFVERSKYHHFNSKRLTRMRIVRKLLFALKGEAFTREILPDFLTAFKSLVKANMSADVLRSLSLFITYSLHKHNPNRPLRMKKSNVQLRRPPGMLGLTVRVPTPTELPPSQDSFTRQQIGVMVLGMYADLLCEDGHATGNLKKFARTVTNKWLLYLLAENDPDVVVLSAKLIARLLVVHGATYIKKFGEKTGGFVIMRHRLKRWWNIPQLWPICFAILFGKDVARIDLTKSLDLFALLETFSEGGKAAVVYPEILQVIMAMLKAGVATIVAEMGKEAEKFTEMKGHHNRRRSLSVNDQISGVNSSRSRLEDLTKLLDVNIQFIAHLHSTCPAFRDFCASQLFMQELFAVIFPVVCSSDHVSAETELNSRDSALTFDGGDVVIRPLISSPTSAPAPIVRTLTVDDRPLSPSGKRPEPRLRRGSSFILVTDEMTGSRVPHTPSSARLSSPIYSHKRTISESVDLKSAHHRTSSVVESLVELVASVFLDLVLERRDFQGFGLNIKVPPGFQEHQIFFETYLLRSTINHLSSFMGFDMKRLQEPKTLTNIARFTVGLTDAIYEGWFLNGAEQLFEFVGTVLEFLQRPDVAKLKTVRLCSKSIEMLRTVAGRLVLFRLAELEEPEFHAADKRDTELVKFLGRMMYWQTVILARENSDADFVRLLGYLLYGRLRGDENEEVRQAACDMMRFVMVQRVGEMGRLFEGWSGAGAPSSDRRRVLSRDFGRLMEQDNGSWLKWLKDHSDELDSFFYGTLSKTWELFVTTENSRTEETGKARISKRREKLKQWILEDMNNEDVFGRHESVSSNWSAGIYASEHLKYQRSAQDLQDSVTYLASQFAKLEAELTRPCGLLDDGTEIKWRLDLTEGRNRMRKRLLPDRRGHLHNYQPKRRMTGPSSSGSGNGGSNGSARPHALSVDGDEISIMTTATTTSNLHGETSRNGEEIEDEDYELVDDPRDSDEWEDKNRKVMRSLQHGDVVEHVHNVSRLIGLDAVEGLLILGKGYLYLIDNFFQRADGEIVNVWQAPKDERDQYLQMISGREADDPKPPVGAGEHDSRFWPFEELISISKRRFLFRDVALELFFADGRSYLLTTMTVKDRNSLHSKLIAKAANVNNTPTPWIGDVWRVGEALKSQDTPSNFGSKLANVFAPGIQNPATKKWVKGEISNFHYLMLVNTMAGRTFNDLTQYPVFPWVLADYTSEELDLTNPRTFRDLSKPMGAQTMERQREFRERYSSFEELKDPEQRPFHYGTHFSSAMIVCSYLIRLQPFVQSYLLLQGGQFDHADRLFHSIEKAWTSASRDNMADVRELIPEFFYLPEFLTNSNNYNFGMKQGTDEMISDVQLPPWAKGDPKIFIAKHREALESPYVSQHLHEWIDLVFGFKQRGEASIEATNVFHHLSYHGNIDLDTILDPVEKLATIGIIHNFGQTPHQVFTRPHASRDPESDSPPRLDTHVESLVRLPFTLMESPDRIAHLNYSPKMDKLFCSGAFRLNIPPAFDKYMEWGYADSSVRFYTFDGKKLIGLHEHLHAGQLSAAIFSDPKTLITAGTDGTVSIWSIGTGSGSIGANLNLISASASGSVGGTTAGLRRDTVELAHKMTLFAHASPVTVMAVSRSFSTLVTADRDKLVAVWDLNRLRFVRTLSVDAPIQAAAVNDVSGDILLCAGTKVWLYTLNGSLIVAQDLALPTTPRGLSPSSSEQRQHDDSISCCVFYEGAGEEWVKRDLIFTGQKRGVVNVWEKRIKPLTTPPKDAGLLPNIGRRPRAVSSVGGGRGGAMGAEEMKWELVRVNCLIHQGNGMMGGTGVEGGGMVGVGAVGSVVLRKGGAWTGDEGGRVFEWDLQNVQRGGLGLGSRGRSGSGTDSAISGGGGNGGGGSSGGGFLGGGGGSPLAFMR